MSQTSREIVQAALRFETPERLPVVMPDYGHTDMAWLPRTPDLPEGGDPMVDEWGCRWGRTDVKNMGQVVGHPLAGVHEFEKARIPDYSKDTLYVGGQEALETAEAEGKYLVAGIFMILFERMHSLAGFENVLMGLMTDPENTGALADRILEAQISLVRNTQARFGSRLDAFNMTEDWGTQTAAFISYDLWCDFFLPRYKRLFDVMHEGGQDVGVHSCGKVNEIVEGFIQAGADSVNLQQPRALGIEEMGRRYRGRVTFESLADIQATLPLGDEGQIRADAQALGEHWMTPEGGFIFSDYGDGEAIGAEPEAKMMMYRAFSDVSQDIYGQPLPEPIID